MFDACSRCWETSRLAWLEFLSAVSSGWSVSICIAAKCHQIVLSLCRHETACTAKINADIFTLQLKEVRREVELSRRRSIKLKAQVDKLQESREGQGWSQHRERVTSAHKRNNYVHHAEICRVTIMSSCSCPSQVKEEVLSILRLLHPLTEPESGPPELATGENHLDDALAQLQNVARKLALSHTQQVSSSPVSCTCKLCLCWL